MRHFIAWLAEHGLSSLVRLQTLARSSAMREQPPARDATWAGRLMQAGLLLTSLGGLALGYWLRRQL